MAALVCGIFACFVIGPVLAVIFGFVARKQIRESNGSQKGKGLATAGIGCGFAWIALFAVSGIFAVTGVFDEEVPTRAAFVETVGDAIAESPEADLSALSPVQQDELRSAFADYAGCIYDVLLDEPRFLVAVYEEPNEDVELIGVSQARMDELDATMERTCYADLEAEAVLIRGG